VKFSDEDVEIRLMAAADLAQVAAIAENLPDAPHWPQSAYAKALNPVSTPRRIALVATLTQPDSLQGFTVASLLPPQAELETIAVAATSQRCGLGRSLFSRLVRELREAGARKIFLEVRASNQAAQAFYRSLGFIQTGLRPRYYTDSIDDAVLMSLKLG